MTFLIGFITFVLFEWGFILTSRKLHMGAPVTERSSHKTFTPTSGGIVIVVSAAVFAYLFRNQLPTQWWVMLGGAAILAVISFIDDIHPLPPVPRLIVQAIVMAAAFYPLCYPQAAHILILVIFCGVGFINALNFLDGISSMLSLYALTIVLTLIYVIANTPQIPDGTLYMELGAWLAIGIAAFAVFNFRDCIFAGDVGSITLGFLLAFIMAKLILATGDGTYFVLIIVCICDTGLTTLHRLFIGENILLPHRKNIYQTLVSKWGIPQIAVSISYALLQLLINALYILTPRSQHWTYLIIVSLMLVTCYFMIRRATRIREENAGKSC